MVTGCGFGMLCLVWKGCLAIRYWYMEFGGLVMANDMWLLECGNWYRMSCGCFYVDGGLILEIFMDNGFG